MADSPVIVNCAVLGNQRCGKSTLVSMFSDPKSTDYLSHYNMTTDPRITNKQVRVPDDDVVYEFFFFDMPGCPLYTDLVKKYIAECQCALILYDANDQDAVESITHWSNVLVEATLQENLPVVLVATHSYEVEDAASVRLHAKISDLADRKGWRLARTNAVDRRDVDLPFMLLADAYNATQ
ncbi:Small GTPase superfamily [Carpediemonas membranifera]|uniref:Small GTPase superfamily n=1 Tax=Carpediemonas membranifera TaxID=201153 RepID=A0A8J6B765_9EUKA|nr:Small GTPase superfamily [Carpediemonas membranifera]|eukprot:KAG9394514.1 Small GTPase superfamily [Carpediemonas membranifera]